MGSSDISNVNVNCITDNTTLSASASTLALSKTGYTEYGVSGTPTSGQPRYITITNTGSVAANNLVVSMPTWPTNTSSSTTCTSTLSAGSSCQITITPGDTTSASCSSGPSASTVSISASNATTISTDVYILGYGCLYQGGYVFAFDDTTSSSTSVGGKVAASQDQSSGIIWSSDSSGAYVGNAIYGISQTSTTSAPDPSSGQVTGQNACNGNTDGSCDTNLKDPLISILKNFS